MNAPACEIYDKQEHSQHAGTCYLQAGLRMSATDVTAGKVVRPLPGAVPMTASTRSAGPRRLPTTPTNTAPRKRSMTIHSSWSGSDRSQIASAPDPLGWSDDRRCMVQAGPSELYSPSEAFWEAPSAPIIQKLDSVKPLRRPKTDAAFPLGAPHPRTAVRRTPTTRSSQTKRRIKLTGRSISNGLEKSCGRLARR